jgi:hypothetical protein
VPLLAPFFNWGTGPDSFFGVARERLNATFHTWDPSPWVFLPDGVTVAPWPRERHWVLASLQNHDRWVKKLGVEWPIIQYGGVKKGGGGIRAGGPDKVVPEADVVRAYASAAGVLSPPYKSAGSGYWRVRFNYAALAGAVMYPGLKDGEQIGPSFTNDMADIEAADDYELNELAARQYQQLSAHEGTTEDTFQSIEEWLS